MRTEAQHIYDQLRAGKAMADIPGNQKTKSKVNRVYLYRVLIDTLIDDLQNGEGRFSTYDLKNMLKRKKVGR